MRNGIPTRKLLERVYVEGASARQGVPTDGVPALLNRAEPLHSAIPVDISGCVLTDDPHTNKFVIPANPPSCMESTAELGTITMVEFVFNPS